MEPEMAGEMVPDPAHTVAGMDTEISHHLPPIEYCMATYTAYSMLSSTTAQPRMPIHDQSDTSPLDWSQDISLDGLLDTNVEPFSFSSFYDEIGWTLPEVCSDGRTWEARTHTTSYLGAGEEKDTYVAAETFREHSDWAYRTGIDALQALHGVPVAMDSLHDKDNSRVQHGDLTPENILMYHQDENHRSLCFMVPEFDLSLLPCGPRWHASGTQMDETIRCRSPESDVREERHAYPPKGIWSFGCRLLGNLAFLASSTAIAYVKPGVLAYYGTWLNYETPTTHR